MPAKTACLECGLERSNAISGSQWLEPKTQPTPGERRGAPRTSHQPPGCVLMFSSDKEVRGPTNSVGFILWAAWMSAQQFTAIRPTVEIFQYRRKWWTDQQTNTVVHRVKIQGINKVIKIPLLGTMVSLCNNNILYHTNQYLWSNLNKSPKMSTSQSSHSGDHDFVCTKCCANPNLLIHSVPMWSTSQRCHIYSDATIIRSDVWYKHHL